MKNLNLAIISSFVLALSLSSCGGTTIEAAEGQNNRSSSNENSGTLSISSSAGDFGSVAISTTVNLYPSGGKSPYTLELLSGDGSLDSSNQTFTASGVESTVGVRVVDADGATAEHYFYVVTSTANNDSNTCIALESAVIAQNANNLEQIIDLKNDSRTSGAHVITGIGLRAKLNNLYAIKTKSKPLGSDGVVSNTPTYVTTKYTDDGNGALVEVYIDAPSGYYIYGVGAATDTAGENFDFIKVYVARPNTASSDFDMQECALERDGALECSDSVDVPSGISHYEEFVGRFNKPMTALGAAVNNGKLDTIAAKSRAISFVGCE